MPGAREEDDYFVVIDGKAFKVSGPATEEDDLFIPALLETETAAVKICTAREEDDIFATPRLKTERAAVTACRVRACTECVDYVVWPEGYPTAITTSWSHSGSCPPDDTYWTCDNIFNSRFVTQEDLDGTCATTPLWINASDPNNSWVITCKAPGQTWALTGIDDHTAADFEWWITRSDVSWERDCLMAYAPAYENEPPPKTGWATKGNCTSTVVVSY